MKPILPLSAGALELFRTLVDKRAPDECWPWLGTVRTPRDGRGAFCADGRTLSAPRTAWALAHGRDPDKYVCHSCDNPRCVNPAHLWLGTSGDNLRDMVTKGRHPNQLKTHCPRGHPLEGDNIRWMRGARVCATCMRAHAMACYARKRAAGTHHWTGGRFIPTTPNNGGDE